MVYNIPTLKRGTKSSAKYRNPAIMIPTIPKFYGPSIAELPQVCLLLCDMTTVGTYATVV